MTVTSANGCQASDTVALTFLSLPTPSLGPDQTPCTGAPVTLNPGSFSAYLWSNGATTTTISPTASGTFAVTVTDVNGCQGTDAILLTFTSPTSFSLGADSTLCADTSVLLSGPSGMATYLWSTGANSASLLATTGGTYSLTVTAPNGCPSADTILLTGLSDCVFPGDANYDGVANHLDVLDIGAYAGRSGPLRPNATLLWYGQAANDWGAPLPAQADPKHSDCNGDGLVQAQDTLAVTANFGAVHSKTSTTTAGSTELYVVPLADTIAPGDTAWFEVWLGSAAAPVDSIYGCAFLINHSLPGILAPGLFSADPAACWFAPIDRIDFQFRVSSTSLAFAATRSDQQDQIGFGKVVRLGILTDPVAAGQDVPLDVMLIDTRVVSAGLVSLPLDVRPGRTIISTQFTQVEEGRVAALLVFPNPAQDWLNITQQGANQIQCEVFDLHGKTVLSHRCMGSEMLLPVGGLSQGVYMLQIRTDQGQYQRMHVLQR